MLARTSPPPGPRRLPWLALGLNAGLTGCSSWLEVPDEPTMVEEAPRVSTVPSAPPPWQPPLEGSRYFGQSAPPSIGERPEPGAPPHSAVSPGVTSPGVLPVPPFASSGAVRDAGVVLVPPPVSDAAVEPPPEGGNGEPVSPPPDCVGAELFGICWYLGEAGESCTQTCAERGGPDSSASAHVGTASQGGSREDCVLILNALGQRYRVRSTEHDVGVGCHVPTGGEDPHWLTSPPFRASAYLRNARIACGCND